MKLIITGASGFVATEVLRQALHRTTITSVVALARNPISPPDGVPPVNASKLKGVVISDYGSYPEHIQRELEGADACIWTVAVTPSKARAFPVEMVRMVCQEWTVAGLQAILDANSNSERTFRFLYMSGSAAYDPAHQRTKDVKVWTPQTMVDYCHMRGKTATQLFELAVKHETQAEVCVAKPGFITGQSGILRGLFGTMLSLTGAVETIDIKVVAAAMLEQVVRGFEGTEGVLLNAEMVQLGNEFLAAHEKE